MVQHASQHVLQRLLLQLEGAAGGGQVCSSQLGGGGGVAETAGSGKHLRVGEAASLEVATHAAGRTAGAACL